MVTSGWARARVSQDGFDKECEPEKSGLWRDVSVISLQLIELIGYEYGTPGYNLVNLIWLLVPFVGHRLPIQDENVYCRLLDDLHKDG